MKPQTFIIFRTHVKVIHCVLSLRASYDKVVAPRLEDFILTHPNIKRAAELADLMAGYSTPHAFITSELNYDSEWKARILQSVVGYVCKIVEEAPTVPEEEVLKLWAIRAKPQECDSLKIKGFKLAGFQYLRMLFGADTAKPDVHIIRFLSDILERDVLDIEALLLLEASSKRVGVSVRAVDNYIWKRGARVDQNADETNTVRLDPDVAVAFPTEEAANEALRFALRVMEDVKCLTHYITPAVEDNQVEEPKDIPEEFNTEYSECWSPILQGELGELFAGEPESINKKSWMNAGWMGKSIRDDIRLWFKLNSRDCYIELYFYGTNPPESRNEVMTLFPTPDYSYENTDTSSETKVKFPVLNKGKNDRDDWDEIREKLVAMGTDIYNKINESDL